ncbi:MAG: prephenate dehydratase [Acidobacteria bacterium]|nr:prephenate dehydratase [Acidobacteriota bacterium]
MTRSTRLRVAFQGERGAFSEEAARTLLGNRIVTVPRANFAQLFRAVRDGVADVLLAPVENSLAGAVQPVHDLLLSSRLHIVGEVVRPIAHCLIGCPGASFAKLTAVQSHPVALAQCERFFAAYPGLQRIAADDTAGSVREIIARGDPRRAAIAGEFAARAYGARILRRHLEDHRKNFTRFFLLSPAAQPIRGADKLSVVFELRHQPGALLRALEPFARRSLNLLKIESRPIPGRPWEYRFYLDVRARAGAPLAVALDDLKRASSRLRVLGHYVCAKEN